MWNIHYKNRELHLHRIEDKKPKTMIIPEPLDHRITKATISDAEVEAILEAEADRLYHLSDGERIPAPIEIDGVPDGVEDYPYQL